MTLLAVLAVSFESMLERLGFLLLDPAARLSFIFTLFMIVLSALAVIFTIRYVDRKITLHEKR